MVSNSTQQNLLLGILALQLEFVGSEQLLAGMASWMAASGTPLGEHLERQGALTAQRRELLDSLARESTIEPGLEPTHSISAKGTKGDSCAAETPSRDARLSATLSLTTLGRAADASVHQRRAVGAWSAAGQRFRIVRPHAEGGLGIVSVASDAELEREVALKEIKPQFAHDPNSRARFTLEAQITGGLEHPGIVPVYGLGQDALGRPFYAMRFIRGDSLQVAVENFHRLGADFAGVEFRKLLNRFGAVCQAMEYAHCRGVLHRDLKPGNIMLGKYGETLVVDWGLAKVAGREEGTLLQGEKPLAPASGSGVEPTEMGSIIGTPAYMSPEQAAGRLVELGPATDIYSLGATFYHLLTGRAPFAKLTPTEIFDRVQRGEFARPRHLNPRVPKALEAICLKAMSPRPADRYARATELAEDLEHWQADDPVSAHRDGMIAWAARWLRKHRAWAVSGAAALGAVAIMASISAVMLSGQKQVISRQEREARLLAERNKTLAESEAAAAKQAETRRIDAETARNLTAQANVALVAEQTKEVQSRQLAEKRLQQSLEAVGLFATHARIFCEDALVPGESRRQLHQVLIKQLEQQADQAADDSSIDVLHSRCLMYQTIGKVYFDSGYQSATAQTWFEKGLATAQQWETKKPNDPHALSFRATYLHLLGTIHDTAVPTRAEEARRHHDEALALRRKLFGNPVLDRLDKGASTASLADSLEALRQFDESLALREEAYRRQPTFEHRDAWCRTYATAANATLEPEKRRELFNTAHEVSAELAKLRPTSRIVHGRWAQVLRELGEIEFKRGNHEEAQKHFQKLKVVSQKLSTSDELLQPLRDYAFAIDALGRVQQRLQKREAALAQFEQSRQIREGLLREFANSLWSLHVQIDLLFSLVHLGRHAEAYRNAEDLLFVCEGEPEAMYRVALLYARGAAAVAESRFPEPLTSTDLRLAAKYRTYAKTAYRKALEQIRVVDLMERIGTALQELNDVEGAILAFRKVIAAAPRYALGHAHLGRALQAKGEIEVALAEFRTAAELDSGNYTARSNVAHALLLSGRPGEAQIEFQNAAALSAMGNPAFARKLEQLAQDCERLQALEKQLPAIQSGELRPDNAFDLLVVARSLLLKNPFDERAIRLYAAAFAADTKLAENLQVAERYAAARCAARVAGRTGQTPPLPASERAALRKQAAEWLEADLALWNDLLSRDERQENRDAVEAAVRPWKFEPELAELRDIDRLKQLPPEEQELCEQLWSKVDRLLLWTETSGRLKPGKEMASLSSKDRRDTLIKGSYHKNYSVALEEGQAYRFDVRTEAFSSFIQLQDSWGRKVADHVEANSAKTTRDSRLVYVAEKSDRYRLVVTTLQGERGGTFEVEMSQPTADEARRAALVQGVNKVAGLPWPEQQKLLAQMEAELQRLGANVSIEDGRLAVRLFDNCLDSDAAALRAAGQNLRDILRSATNPSVRTYATHLESSLRTLDVLGTTLEFTGKLIDGQSVDLAKPKGKLLLVMSWTPGEQSNLEQQSVLKAHEKYHAQGFEVLGAGLVRDDGEIVKHLADKKLPWSCFTHDDSRKLWAKYQSRPLPFAFLVDQDGRIVSVRAHGPLLETLLVARLGRKQ